MANHQHNYQNRSEHDIKQGEVAVMVIPFLAQGHLNQLLHISRLISSYNLPVHFISTTTHTRQAKLRVQGWDPISTSNIHFHELQTPNFVSPLPDPKASTKFPSHLLPALDASSQLREPFAKILSALSPAAKRVIVIYDYLMGPVVQDAVSFPNAEAYVFQCCSAFTTFSYHWETMGKPTLDEVTETVLKQIPSMEGCLTPDGLKLIKSRAVATKNFNSGIIYDTSKVIEGKYLDLLCNEEIKGTTNHWAFGPFNPVAVTHTKDSSEQRHKLLEWLDKQAENSVIYVSFGTTTCLSDKEIQELAIGLEKSDQNFIWVLRDADKGDIFGGGEVRRVELPKGYEERVNGIVVRDWAPQLEILGHPSTGGFMSHCGWNSCMESITMGVPIAAWPMNADQPRNAFLITNVLRIGLVVKDWERKDELVTSLTVEEAVRRLMATSQGDEIRKRAAQLGGAVRRSVAEGGIARMELDSFIAHVTR